MAWGNVLDKAHEDFQHKKAKAFSAPAVKAEGKGYEVTFWYREPAGMVPQTYYNQMLVKFNKKGNITSHEKVDGFAIRMAAVEDD